MPAFFVPAFIRTLPVERVVPNALGFLGMRRPRRVLADFRGEGAAAPANALGTTRSTLHKKAARIAPGGLKF